MQSLLAFECHKLTVADAAPSTIRAGMAPLLAVDVNGDDSLLRSTLNGRDGEPILGLLVVLRYRFIQALLNNSYQVRT